MVSLDILVVACSGGGRYFLVFAMTTLLVVVVVIAVFSFCRFLLFMECTLQLLCCLVMKWGLFCYVFLLLGMESCMFHGYVISLFLSTWTFLYRFLFLTVSEIASSSLRNPWEN